MGEKVYTDDSYYKIGNSVYKLEAAPRRALARIYRQEKNNPGKKDLAFIDYVEENVEKWIKESENEPGLLENLKGLVREYIEKDRPKKLRAEKLSDICESGKIIYLSKQDAREALAEIRESKQEHKKPERSYECDKCNWWHLTSVPFESWKKSKRK
ncbi:MAG: hypothetical protein ACI88L_000633 [Candidatus Paceibacteria bacterium]|jgi:hypothetical protein